jgi:hypothetical protein
LVLVTPPPPPPQEAAGRTRASFNASLAASATRVLASPLASPSTSCHAYLHSSACNQAAKLGWSADGDSYLQR